MTDVSVQSIVILQLSQNEVKVSAVVKLRNQTILNMVWVDNGLLLDYWELYGT